MSEPVTWISVLSFQTVVVRILHFSGLVKRPTLPASIVRAVVVCCILDHESAIRSQVVSKTTDLKVKKHEMQIRQIVPNGETWDIKTSSPVTLRVSNTDATVCQLQQKMTLSWQQVLSHKYQYQYQWSKYQYKYQYLACKYKYKYQYPKIVLKYRSSTSTSTQYNKTAV